MSKLPGCNPNTQAQAHVDRAVSTIAASLIVLGTRDGIFIPSELVLERARNIVAALGADFELVPLDRVAGLREALATFKVAADGMRDAFQAEAGR